MRKFAVGRTLTVELPYCFIAHWLHKGLKVVPFIPNIEGCTSMVIIQKHFHSEADISNSVLLRFLNFNSGDQQTGLDIQKDTIVWCYLYFCDCKVLEFIKPFHIIPENWGKFLDLLDFTTISSSLSKCILPFHLKPVLRWFNSNI